MENWNRDYHGIGLSWEDNIVRILNDDKFRTYLKTGKRQASFKLALYILHMYQKRFSKPLGFSAKSLACEIYGHYYISEKAKASEKKRGKRKLTSWLQRHMDVIDCGTGKVDNNRFLWDLLSLMFIVKKKK